MTKKLLNIAALIMIVGQVNAQGPTLNLVGGSPSLTKGTINTEVLTAIIQQKQEEVKQMIFRNTIVKEFNHSNYTNSLKNFTTYHFLYNLMDAMTSGKNKTAITKSIIQNSAEFAFIYGFVWYVRIGKDSVIANTKLKYSDNKIYRSKKLKEFNLRIDICYDVILNDTGIKKLKFNFNDNLNDKYFATWYNNDNCYKKSISAFDSIITKNKIDYKYIDQLYNTGTIDTIIFGKKKTDADKISYLKSRRDALLRMREIINKKLDEFLMLIETAMNNKSLTLKIDSLLSTSVNSNASAIEAEINKIKMNFENSLTKEQTLALNFLLNKAYINDTKELIDFYSGLEKSKFTDFTMTKNQYYAMKFIIDKFLELVKNQYNNDVVATVIDFMLENTLIEYADAKSGEQILEKNASHNDKGYLYVDIESLISSIDQKFSSTNKKGLRVYITPFFSIGANYASFMGSNSLTKDANGASKSLSNLYYASEKIGIKWKIWNWQYTHSFSAGENFRYYNSKKTSRYWLRPQPKPTVSDIHFFVYGSGLLYNIANLKSNDNFNYAIAGAGLGMTFFNGLTANFSIACPFTDNKFYSNNMFLNLGLDFPIIEYIVGLSKK